MTVIIFLFFFASSFTLRRLSVRQDATGDPGCTTKSRKVSFASIPLFGVLLTAAAIFWVMSITYPLVFDHVGRVRLRRERVEFDGDAHHHHAPAPRARAT